MTMSELAVIDESCRCCGDALLASDNFCRKCGLPTSVPVSPSAEVALIDSRQSLAVIPTSQTSVAPRPVQSLVTEVLNNRLFVIAMLLCVGPLGLPALWFSHRFSRPCKVITTTGYLLCTVVLPLAVAWCLLDIAVRPIVDALS